MDEEASAVVGLMPEVMPKALQKHTLSEWLRRGGIEPDTVDLEALIDPTLHLYENRDNIARQLSVRLTVTGEIIPTAAAPPTRRELRALEAEAREAAGEAERRAREAWEAGAEERFKEYMKEAERRREEAERLEREAMRPAIYEPIPEVPPVKPRPAEAEEITPIEEEMIKTIREKLKEHMDKFPEADVENPAFDADQFERFQKGIIYYVKNRARFVSWDKTTNVIKYMVSDSRIYDTSIGSYEKDDSPDWEFRHKRTKHIYAAIISWILKDKAAQLVAPPTVVPPVAPPVPRYKVVKPELTGEERILARYGML